MELNFYCRAASSEQIDNYKESKNLKHLGVPDLKGSGSFIYRKKKLRFVVIPKYGTDIQSVLEESKSQTLSVQSASYIAHQIVSSDCKFNFNEKNIILHFRLFFRLTVLSTFILKDTFTKISKGQMYFCLQRTIQEMVLLETFFWWTMGSCLNSTIWGCINLLSLMLELPMRVPWNTLVGIFI